MADSAPATATASATAVSHHTSSLPSVEKPTVESEVVPGVSGPVDAEAALHKEGEGEIEDESQYVTGRKLLIIFLAMMLTMFLVTLDQTIVSTALPSIVSDFDALSDVIWIPSAYFLTQAGLMLTCGQFLSIAPTKWVYMASIFFFEVGSLICGVAPNVNVLIFGRAVAGAGGAGIFVAVLSIIAQITRLKDRPALFGAFGAIFAISSIAGPLLGGAFTDHVTWRWCFYINLPIGGIALVVIFFLLEARPALVNEFTEGKPWYLKGLAVDWIGTVLCLGMVTSLILPLQWGGNTKPWKDPSVIACFCVFGVLLAAFLGWQHYKRTRAILPLRMFRKLIQIGCCSEAFFLLFALLVVIYYLPLWYQATRGHSATKSGLDILPFMLSVVVAAGVSGAVIAATGRYIYWLRFSPLIAAIASGLFWTVDKDTPNPKIIGFQILYGIGVGGALQNTVIAIQAEYASHPSLIPQATSIVSFIQLLGGVLGIAIAGTVFDNQLKHFLPIFAPGLPSEIASAISQSVTVIRTLDPEIQEAVITAYVASLRGVFIIGVPSAILASLSSFMITNYNIRKREGALQMHGGMA